MNNKRKFDQVSVDNTLVQSAQSSNANASTNGKKRKFRSKAKKEMRCWPEPFYYYPKNSSSENFTIVCVYVDGACSGNEHKRVEERIGGFGAWCEQTDWEFSGFLDAPCTNNRGELQAVIHVLKKAIDEHMDKKESNVACKLSIGDQVHSELRILGDNEIVLKTITKWLPDWRRRGYLKADNKPPENLDLVKQLESLLQQFEITKRPLSFQWVSAHAKEPTDKNSQLWKMWSGNEKADFLATRGAKIFGSDLDWMTLQ